MMLLTGVAATIPGITDGNIATESISENEAIRKNIARQKTAKNTFIQTEYTDKQKKARNVRINKFYNQTQEKGEKVWYQRQDRKDWVGPAEVVLMDGRNVYILANVKILKVASCKVKPFNDKDENNEVDKEDELAENKFEQNKRSVDWSWPQ